MSEYEERQIVSHHRDKMSQSQIAQKIKCPQCAVQTTLEEGLQSTV